MEAPRTFTSMDEVRRVEGYKDDNPVSEGTYSALLGDYNFAEKVKCCVQTKLGARCNTSHNFGYVVLLKDGSASIVGNRCADDKFDAKSKLSQDRNHHENAKRRAKVRQRVAELLATRDADNASIEAAYSWLTSLAARVREVEILLGDACSNQLRLVAHGGTGRIGVNGVSYRRGQDENGKPLTERTQIQLTAGVLQGLDILKSSLITGTKDDLRKVSRALSEAERLGDDVKTSVLEGVASVIADLPRILGVVRELDHAERLFRTSDWAPMVFLVRSESDRVKVARAVLGHAGNPGGRDKAKALIQKMETDLKTRFGVERLEIIY